MLVLQLNIEPKTNRMVPGKRSVQLNRLNVQIKKK